MSLDDTQRTSYGAALGGLKRRRVDEDGSADGATKDELTRDEVVWFEDGNIIVRAGPGCTGAGPVYGFKCHKSVLATKSQVFDTLFQLPNGGGETVDGVQTVDFPDKWEDVRDFLRFLYGSFPLPAKTRDPSMLQAIAGPLRLAVKYDCASVVEQLRPTLERDWPDNFDEWVLLEDQTSALMKKQEGRLQEPFDVNWYFPDPAHTVRLAQETRVRGILRAAWYDLSRCYFLSEEDFHASVPNFDPLMVYRRITDISVLDTQDLRRLLIAGERMRNFLQWHLLREVTDGLRRHTGPALCEKVEDNAERTWSCGNHVRKWWNDKTSDYCLVELTRDPLGHFLAMRRALSGDGYAEDLNSSNLKSVCFSCRRWFTAILHSRCRMLWDMLPEIYDLRSLGWKQPPTEPHPFLDP